MKSQSEITICGITAKFPPEYGGGAKQAFSLYTRLSKLGVKCFIITQTDRRTKKLGLNEESMGGLSVYRYRVPSFRWGKMRTLLFYIRLLLFLVQKRHEYDIVHCHSIHTHTLIAILASKLLGKRVITKMAGMAADSASAIAKKRLGWLRLKICSLADRIIATSSELYLDAIDSNLPGNKIVQIPNGVDTVKFREVALQQKLQLREALSFKPDEILVTFVGMLRWVKGIDVLIDCWSDVTEHIPNAKLLLVGPESTNERVFLKTVFSKVEERSLSSKVIRVGHVENVEEYLQISDIFVLPSRAEGMPNSLLEAMACSLTCVASDSSCIQDLIQHNYNGLLFECDNSKQLGERIIHLARNVDLRRCMGVRARKTITARFSLDAVAGKYLKLYKELY